MITNISNKISKYEIDCKFRNFLFYLETHVCLNNNIQLYRKDITFFTSTGDNFTLNFKCEDDKISQCKEFELSKEKNREMMLFLFDYGTSI